jgi:hypothetical protein
MSADRYRFGAESRRGPIGSLRAGQVVIGGSGVLWAVALIDLAPSGGGVVAALLGLAGAALAATLPVGGLTVEQWLPVTMGWVLARADSRVWQVRAAGGADGVVVDLPAGGVASRTRVTRSAKPRPPRALADVRLLGLPYRGREIGAVAERGGRRLTLVLVGRAPGFALADQAEQQQRLGVWAEVLQSATRGAVRRIGWVERTAPAQGDGLARWLHEQRDPAVPLAGELGRSYLELLESSAQATREHEVLLALQLDAASLRGGGREAAERALISAGEQISRALERARVQVQAAPTPGGLARILRVAFDPYVHPQLAALRAGGGGDELSEAAAWPAGLREQWACLQVDGAMHATFEIGGWPRAEVGPAFLGSLLGPSDHVRAVSVVFEPLDPLRSLRQAEFEITRDETDRQTRRRFGQMETARQRHASDAARWREAELAAGHAEVRLAGFVTVTGRDQDELDAACADVVTHAGRANLELRRLYGQQAEAFTFTLPLCRGLR